MGLGQAGSDMCIEIMAAGEPRGLGTDVPRRGSISAIESALTPAGKLDHATIVAFQVWGTVLGRKSPVSLPSISLPRLSVTSPGRAVRVLSEEE